MVYMCFFLAFFECDILVRVGVICSNAKDNVSIVDGKYVVTGGPFNRYSCTRTAYNYRKRCSHTDGVKNV